MTITHRISLRRLVSTLEAGTSRLALAAAIAAPIITAGTVSAVAQAEATGPIETVVVTAQFTESNLQATPLAITAVTAQEIQDRGLTNITELGQAMPNVRLTIGGSAFGNTAQNEIRGIGQGDFNFAFEPGVGMYVDDVYYATMFGTVFDLLDLDRVEVIRGPSGTLFGKNSIGGAIRLLSRKPVGDNSGSLEITYGDFDRIDVRATADVSIVQDKLSMRITAVSKQRDGYQDVIDFACAHPSLAGTLPVEASQGHCSLGTYGGEDARAARIAFRALLGKAEINVDAHVMQDTSQIQADTLIGIDLGPIEQPGGFFINQFNGSFTQHPYSEVAGSGCVLCGFWNARVNVPTYGIPWDTRFFTDSIYKTYANYTSFDGIREPRERTVNSWGTHASFDLDVMENVHFRNIIAYQQYEGNISHDADGSPLSIQIANSTVGNFQWTEEARFTGTAFDDRLDWTLGGFYLESVGKLHGPVLLDLFGADAAPYGAGCPGSPATCPPVPPLRFGQNDRIEVTSYSFYVHGVFKVTDRWNVFGGYRYSHDEKSYLFDHSLAVPGVPASGFFAITDPAVTADPRNDYRIGTDFHITDDHMIYAQIATGYRAGGINPRPFSPAQLTTFGPEQATAYEVGAKTDWLDHRIRANVAFWLTDYKDRIVNQQILDADGLPFTGPINLGTATVKGFEVEVTAAPFDGLLLTGSFGLTDIKLDAQEGSPPGFIDPAGTIPTGSITPGVPERTAGFSAQYTWGNAETWGTLTPRIDWSYTSRVFGDNANTRVASVAPRDNLNGRITWDAPVGDWSVAFTVTNIEDDEYFVNKFTLLNFGLGTLEGQPGRPREWAVIMRKTF